jgi:hypothetical protein
MNARILTLGLAALLGGCATAAPERTAAPVQPPVTRPYTTVGLGTVIGRTAALLESQFGRPDLDIREGSARKLQFSGAACVLDAYLYPPKAGGEPIVTHIDTRLPDGNDMDRASCVAAMTRK